MEKNLSKSDLQAIRNIVRSEMRKSSFSKMCSSMKAVLLVLIIAAAILGLAAALDKLMKEETSEE